MKKNIYRKATTVLAISLCSTNAFPTTSYTSEGHLTLEVIGFTDNASNKFDFDNRPPVINISNTDNSNDDNYMTSITGDAFADAVATPFSSIDLIDLDTQTSGEAGNPYAYAQSDATASASFQFENTSSTEDYTIDLILNYSFSGIVQTDTPLDQQNGETTIDINLFGDFSLDQILTISEAAGIEQEGFLGSESEVSISFLLKAGKTENIYANILSYGESESVSAVPLPASIFLMIPALMGLVIRRNNPLFNKL
jgi:hypothetical protein